ncbi:hypothetical protein [Candidatus Poriferisocius sp.]|uniref:hypothetical protein n=1 Tax=Candidatus Poriferisocius sp. TaxID=3101276 RepID=UPI003B5B3626
MRERDYGNVVVRLERPANGGKDDQARRFASAMGIDPGAQAAQRRNCSFDGVGAAELDLDGRPIVASMSHRIPQTVGEVP